MFQTFQKPSGRDYTATVAFVLIALVVCPAVLAMSSSLGVTPVLLTVALSTGSLMIARYRWMNHSMLTIPTLEMAPARVK